jgi:hypothetical protein
MTIQQGTAIDMGKSSEPSSGKEVQPLPTFSFFLHPPLPISYSYPDPLDASPLDYIYR